MSAKELIDDVVAGKNANEAVLELAGKLDEAKNKRKKYTMKVTVEHDFTPGDNEKATKGKIHDAVADMMATLEDRDFLGRNIEFTVYPPK